MQVHFHRTDRAGGYAVIMRRDDGLTVRLPGLDRSFRVPHDLAHFVTEREFQLGRGVFGSIAAGAMFSNMAVVGGRPRYDAKVRSRAVIRAHSAELSLAEVLSGVVHDGVEHESTTDAVYRQLVLAYGSLRPGPCPYQVATLRRCLGLLWALEGRWRAVPVGQRLALRWEPPGIAPASAAPAARTSPPG